MIRLKKAELAERLEAAESDLANTGVAAAGGSMSSFLARRQRGSMGGQISAAQSIAMRTEVAALQESISEIQARMERSSQIEKKLLTAMETIASKVDSLVDREKDFRFLRKGLTGDYLS